MSKTKKKNSDYNYKNREEIKLQKENEKKAQKKSNAIYNWFSVFAWILLIAIVVLAVQKYNGTYPHSEKIFLPLTAVAMFLLTYKNKKLSKRMSIICYIITALDVVWSVIIFFI